MPTHVKIAEIMSDLRDANELIETLQIATHLQASEREPYLRQLRMLINRVKRNVEEAA